jgi:F420H(2)-dependent quinone reductase
MRSPRWLYEVGWALHRGPFSASGGRLGTARASHVRLGTLFLTTVGRRSGQPRRNGLYYLEDGVNLVVVASNAGSANDPAWWLNLQAQPTAQVQLGPARRRVRARPSEGEERVRLWRRLAATHPEFADYQAEVAREIPVVVLEPADAEPADAQPADAQPADAQPADAQPAAQPGGSGTPTADPR